ncbi:hypothetical protein GJAV_G00130390 [Gymnothorax javanicus]|nr:hypothetical protein GJAV_G00130390 [Gymnothorax javanicus]
MRNLHIILYNASTALPTPTKNVDSTPVPDANTEAPDPHCSGMKNFEPCLNPDAANCKGNSQCSCKDEKHFCRCNNDNEKWYIGEDCEQEWTVVTFALVASLPGVALAAMVGVAVYICSRSGKKKSAAKVKSSKPQKAGPHKESSPEYGYANMVFASDIQNGRKPQPVRASPSHDNIPMAGPRADSSYWDNSHKNSHASAQPSRNPYNSPERYGGYRNPYAEENSTARGSQPGYQDTNPYMPTFSAPDYGGSKSQFPRAQVGRQY